MLGYTPASTANPTFTGQIFATSGLIGSLGPAYAFTGATNTGMYTSGGSAILIASGTGSASVTSGGNVQLNQSGGAFVLQTGTIQWNSADLVLTRDSAAVLQLGADSATAISQTLKAADGSGTDKVGGGITIEGGQSTGTATSGKLDLATGLVGEASASTVNAFSIRAHYQPKFVALSDATTNEIIRFSLAANKVLGGELVVTTYATNSTPHLQCRTTVLAFQAVAVSTAITATIDVVKAGTLAADSGAMTETFTIVDNGGNTFSIIDSVDSDLTSPTDRCKIIVTSLNGNAAVTITDP